MKAMLPVRHISQTALRSSSLTVNRPGDQFEQEADRIADEIVFGASRKTQIVAKSLGAIQRKCRQCAGSEEEQNLMIQAKELQGLVPSITPELASRLKTPGDGRFFPSSLRALFEPQLGHELSDVRLHTDRFAAGVAKDLSARAFTLGRNVFFGEGEFRPTTTEGLRLLAHELTHVAQQGAVPMRADAHQSVPEVLAIHSPAEPLLQREECQEANRDEGGTGQVLIQHWLKEHGKTATGATWLKEVEIPGGGKSGGTGFADLVRVDGNSVQIFELKTGQEDTQSASSQAIGYADAFRKACSAKGAFTGKTVLTPGDGLGVSEFPGPTNNSVILTKGSKYFPGAVNYEIRGIAHSEDGQNRAQFKSIIENRLDKLAMATITTPGLKKALPKSIDDKKDKEESIREAKTLWLWLLRMPLNLATVELDED